jgi:MFS family permease
MSWANAVMQPPIAKLADVFGRTEASGVSMLLYVLGLVKIPAASSLSAYASAQIFGAAGNMGLCMLQQVFVADTSDLLIRVLIGSISYLVTVWIGPYVRGRVGSGYDSMW